MYYFQQILRQLEPNDARIFEAFQSYDFMGDQNFLAGWKSIEANLESSEIDQKLEDVKFFYFSR